MGGEQSGSGKQVFFYYPDVGLPPKRRWRSLARNKKILVVEDNLQNRKLVCDLLRVKGYDIYEASTAEVALQIIRDQAPDLILMDVQLPGMNGLTLTRKLREDPATRNIIIALTASAMKDDQEKALQAGCDGYITKPIDTRALPNTIARFLGSEI